MQQQQSQASGTSVYTRNVGGIQESEISFEPGVTVLVGRNATNRTSFLQAVMAALGSENVAMKGDADDAEVNLDTGDETYTRTFNRGQTGIERGGDPYLDDPELADLFAFLLESNEARRAVATNADLRELIMRPVDTEEIQTEIERLQGRKESLESELEAIEDRKGEIQELEARRETLREQIEETNADLEATETELDEADADPEARREEQSELETRLEALREKRAELDDVRYELDTEQESLQALKRERREHENELADLDDIDDASDIDARLGELRERKSELDTQVNELQSVIQFNEGMLDDGSAAPVKLTRDDDGTVTDKLVDDNVTCWTCGTAVNPEQIETTIEQLRERSQSKVGEVDRVEGEIEELQQEKRDLERTRQERERLKQRLDELDDEIDRTEVTVDELRDRRKELTGEIETVEKAVDELESEKYDEVLEVHRTANELEYELGRLEGDLAAVTDDIAEAEAHIEEESEVREELDEVNEELERLRMRIEHIESEAVDQFNEHMDSVLGLLGYANLDRIWIERVEREIRSGRRKETERAFELHVVRSTDSGAAYEDTIDHLSESEREVTGLVFALAGYLVHEVYETVPFMVLDSLEAIDADRIATLVDYFSAYSQYVLVALLPEDAAALDDEYERITDI